MADTEKESIAAGAAGSMLNDGDKKEVQEAATAPKKKARRGRPPKRPAPEPEEKESTETLERRLAEVEQKLAAHNISSNDCHMCHKPGATTQRGNTGEWFHGPCLDDFKMGKDPVPVG